MSGEGRATVIIPTFDNGEPLRYALASAQAQTVAELDIVVIGDGTTDATREIVREAMATDDRVRFVDRPKGPRHGERYRHEVLQGARGEIVCYLCDDDLWVPGHVEEMARLLEDADFAHTGTLLVWGDGGLGTWLIDLADPTDRDRARTESHDLNLSAMGHRLDAYGRLPHGWRTTPRGFNTDHWMTRQFLEQPWVRAVSGTTVTNIHPANSFWRDRTPAEKLEATRWFAAGLADPAWCRDELPALVLAAHRNSWARTRARERRYRTSFERVTATRWWRARESVKSAVGRARASRQRGG